MERISIQYFGFTEPQYKEKVVIPSKKTILQEIVLPQYEINQEKSKIQIY